MYNNDSRLGKFALPEVLVDCCYVNEKEGRWGIGKKMKKNEIHVQPYKRLA